MADTEALRAFVLKDVGVRLSLAALISDIIRKFGD